MALKVPRKLQDKWEAILKDEGLAPIDGPYSDGAREHRDLVRHVNETSVAEIEYTRAYYRRASKFLGRLVLAHAVWALHVEGYGGRAIAERLAVPYKVVRLTLERLQELAGLNPQSFGGAE